MSSGQNTLKSRIALSPTYYFFDHFLTGDYIKPTLQKDPDVIILHAGTNDMKPKDPVTISEDILDLVKQIKSDNNTVVISSILPRNDKYNEKVKIVNRTIKKMCSERNIGYIEHENFNEKYHLNKSKIHPNMKGNTIIARNF